MSARLWKRQLSTLKAHVVLQEIEPTTIFIDFVDCGVPDPDGGTVEVEDYSEQALVGYRPSPGEQCFLRLEREKLTAFQKRVHRAAPDRVIFWPIYRKPLGQA